MPDLTYWIDYPVWSDFTAEVRHLLILGRLNAREQAAASADSFGRDGDWLCEALLA